MNLRVPKTSQEFHDYLNDCQLSVKLLTYGSTLRDQVSSSYRFILGARGRSSSPGTVKNFLFSTVSRPALGSTQPPMQ
jgi:hypothetical protein